MGYSLLTNQDFVTQPILPYPTASLVMAKEKSGKSVLFANVPKIAVLQYDREAYKVPVRNVVDMNIWKILGKPYDKESIPTHTDWLKSTGMSVKPMKYILDKEHNLFTYVPPSLRDYAFEVREEMGQYRKLERLVTEAKYERDSKKYMLALEALREYVEVKMTSPIAVIDNLSSLYEEVLDCALENYREKFPKLVKENVTIKTVDTYGGTQFIRFALTKVAEFIQTTIAPIIVYVGHTKTKYANKDVDELTASDLALEGQNGSIFTQGVESVSVLSGVEGEGIFMDFAKKEPEQPHGSRCINLNGTKIKVAEWAKEGEDPTLVTKHLNKIWPFLK